MPSKFTREQVDALKATHPEIYSLTGVKSGIEVIVRPASRAEYLRFTTLSANPDPTKRAASLKQLLLDCLLAPSPVELNEAEERFPGSIHQLATELRDIAGAFEEVTRAKL